jgi:fatty acid desaturase
MNREILALTAEFSEIKPAVYWGDLIGSAVLGWSALLVLAAHERPWPATAALTLLAVTFLYRGLSFLHEVAHSGRHLPGFTLAFNLLFGFPLKSPSYTYEPHLRHHSRSHFGTEQDPEYEQWSYRAPLNLLRPLLMAAVGPLLFLARYGLAPALLAWMPDGVYRWVYRHASTYAMNPRYRREPSAPGDLPRARRQDLACTGYTAAFLVLNCLGALPWRFWGALYAVVAIIILLNAYRALANHRYDSGRRSQTYEEQVLDSVTIPGAWWTEIWAPTALRYHSTHHMLPSLPYHSLGAAHRKLMRELPGDHPYRRTIEKSWNASIGSLWRRMRAAANESQGCRASTAPPAAML